MTPERRIVLDLARTPLNDRQALSDLMVRAGELAKRVQASKARRREKAAPRVLREKVQNLNAVAAHVDLIRKVMARPGFICELGEHNGADGVDPHHLEMGQGKAKRERISNVLRACRTCHDAYHLRASTFIPAVVRWCGLHGYPLPNRKEFRR